MASIWSITWPPEARSFTHWPTAILPYAARKCLRDLWTTSSPTALLLQAGVNEVKVNGNLRGKPTLILHGRVTRWYL